MRKSELKPKIIKYLAKRLNKSENTIRKNISLLRRSYISLSLNAIAHIYAMENGYSVMRMLSPEDKKDFPFFISGYREVSKNKIKKKRKQTMITPETGFSNIKLLLEIIREADDYFWWVDKHFSKKGLEPLSEELNNKKIKEVKLLLGITSTGIEKLKDYFKRFKEEMNTKGINVECHVIIDKNILNSIHGRWIITKSKAYSVPPINSWYQGQYDEVKRTLNRPPFLNWWKSSKDILTDWNDIIKYIKN